MKTILFAFLLLFGCQLCAQKEDTLIRQTVDNLFLSMQTGDSALLNSCFMKDATLKTVYINNKGATQLHSESIANFAIAVGTPHKEKWNERIHDVEIRIDGPLAFVWAPYSFYVDETYSHSGVNAFELVHIDGKWLILSITDTRRK